MLFSGTALINTYRSVAEYRNTYEGSVEGSPLPTALKMQYFYCIVVAAFEVIIIIYLLRKTSTQYTSDKNMRYILIILVPELYALFLLFGTPIIANTVGDPITPPPENPIKLKENPSSSYKDAASLLNPIKSDK